MNGTVCDISELKDHNSGQTVLEDISEKFAMVPVQGPLSEKLLKSLLGWTLSDTGSQQWGLEPA
jgi:glycine cleavage system aminomethyltransferase T